MRGTPEKWAFILCHSLIKQFPHPAGIAPAVAGMSDEDFFPVPLFSSIALMFEKEGSRRQSKEKAKTFFCYP